jgi:hypothetical protein
MLPLGGGGRDAAFLGSRYLFSPNFCPGAPRGAVPRRRACPAITWTKVKRERTIIRIFGPLIQRAAVTYRAQRSVSTPDYRRCEFPSPDHPTFAVRDVH